MNKTTMLFVAVMQIAGYALLIYVDWKIALAFVLIHQSIGMAFKASLEKIKELINQVVKELE